MLRNPDVGEFIEAPTLCCYATRNVVLVPARADAAAVSPSWLMARFLEIIIDERVRQGKISSL